MRLNKRYRFYLLLLLCLGTKTATLSAQAPSDRATCSVVGDDFCTYYRSPLDVTIYLSGNYGEFRSNHFHTGFDIRIGGVTGAKLFAVADGFVSRVSVSPSGYGNALYIEHPNGTTSVYGHLLDFEPAIQEYIKERQYEKNSFAVDLSFGPETFPLRQGDFVGRAGNSGSSGGPHLHFELRNTELQASLNYSAYGLFPVTDRIPPKLTRLQFWSYSMRSGVPESTLLKSADLAKPSTVIPVSDTFYMAIGAHDLMEGSTGLLSLTQYDVYIDNNKVYTYKKTEVPPSMSRYVNSLIQYEQKVKYQRSLLKTWVEPGNALRFQVESPTDGLFCLSDSLIHPLRIELTDDYGNTSKYQFKVQKQAVKQASGALKGRVMLWMFDNYCEGDGCRVYIPWGSLYKNIDFSMEPVAPPAGMTEVLYTPVWRIHTPEEPLQRSMRLTMDASGVPEALRDKALIVSVGKDGQCSGAGGRWNGSSLEINTMQFGDYAVAIDTVPPRIKPNFRAGADLRKNKRLSFVIGDKLSGLASYEGYIDGEWALFEYDAKSATLFYVFDKKRIGSGKTHQLELRLTDGRNNVSTYKTTFLW